MKSTFKADDAIDGLAKVVAVISPRTTLPVLGMVKMQCADGQITFTATNLDSTMTFRCPADGKGCGLIPGRVLLSAVRLAAGEIMSISIDRRGELRAGVKCLEFEAVDAGEFPNTHFKGHAGFTVLGCDLARGLAFVKHTMSSDESRYNICGARFEIGEDMVLIATDGRRLSHLTLPCEGNEGRHAFTLPSPAVALVESLCGHDRISFRLDGESAAVIEAGAFTLHCKLTDANYPDWRHVLVKEEDVRHRFTLQTDALCSALAWTKLAVSEKTNGVRFCGSVLESGWSELRSHTSLAGCPDALATTILADYLAALCEQFGSSVLGWNYCDTLLPSWFTDGQRHLVVMPMKLE